MKLPQLKHPLSIKLAFPSFPSLHTSNRTTEPQNVTCVSSLASMPYSLSILMHSFENTGHDEGIHYTRRCLHDIQIITNNKGLCSLPVRSLSPNQTPTYTQAHTDTLFPTWIWRRSYDYCASPRKLVVYFCCLSGSLASLAT